MTIVTTGNIELRPDLGGEESWFSVVFSSITGRKTLFLSSLLSLSLSSFASLSLSSFGSVGLN